MEKYIEIAKKRHNLSQNALAKKLGLAPSYFSQMKIGSVGWSDEALVKLAKGCGERPEKLKAEYELTKVSTPEVKMMWERIAGHAAVFLITICASASIFIASVEQYILC